MDHEEDLLSRSRGLEQSLTLRGAVEIAFSVPRVPCGGALLSLQGVRRDSQVLPP